MPSLSSLLMIGLPQNVQGPKPSLTHITFPHDKQFGAAASKGWRVAMQLHARSALDCVLGEPLSRVLIKASSSDRFLEAEDIGVPPISVTFACCLFAGLELLVLGAEAGFGLGSDIRRPAAEGGSLFAGGV